MRFIIHVDQCVQPPEICQAFWTVLISFCYIDKNIVCYSG